MSPHSFFATPSSRNRQTFQHCFSYMRGSSRQLMSSFSKSQCAKLQRLPASHFLSSPTKRGECNRETYAHATRLRCWNHIFRGAHHWGHSHNIKANEVQGFVADLKELFHKPSVKAYETELQLLSASWKAGIHIHWPMGS